MTKKTLEMKSIVFGLTFIFCLGTLFLKNKALADTLEAGKTLFNTKCIACHTYGQGKRLGPDLKGITKRRKTAWLKKMIQKPDEMVKTDSTAKALLKEYNNLPMTNFGLKDKEVTAILDYLKHQDTQTEKKDKKK